MTKIEILDRDKTSGTTDIFETRTISVWKQTRKMPCQFNDPQRGKNKDTKFDIERRERTKFGN